MALDKNSLKADAVANYYRAALYLAKGNLETGLDFLKKAKVFFPDETTGFEEILKTQPVL